MSEIGPSPVDRGKVGIFWVTQGIAALFVVALAFATAFVPFSPISTRVDPATLPPGTGYVVVDNSTGPAAYLRCPSMTAWMLGDQPEVCADAVRSMTGGVGLAGAGTIVAVACFVQLRRARRREAHRATAWFEPIEPVPAYRHLGMPGMWWLALALIGGLTALLALGSVMMRATDDAWTFAGVAFYGAVLYQVAWVHGVRRAYEVTISGPSLRWRAPLRSITVPLDTVDTAVLPWKPTLASSEGVARIELADGRSLPITLPGAHRRRQFSAFCETLRARGIDVAAER